MIKIKLTNPERLYIIRKRLGLNQTQMANFYQVCESVYNKWETGKNPCDNVPEQEDLSKNEVLTLLRKRSGKKQWELANEMGVTKLWINRLETGKEKNIKKLEEYWEINAR